MGTDRPVFNARQRRGPGQAQSRGDQFGAEPFIVFRHVPPVDKTDDRPVVVSLADLAHDKGTDARNLRFGDAINFELVSAFLLAVAARANALALDGLNQKTVGKQNRGM